MTPLRIEVARPDRRRVLAGLSAMTAASLAACAPPAEEIVPAVDQGGGPLPGQTARFATTLTLAGYGRGVTGLVRDGRPYKLEGSSRHPASLGATDVFAEAAILDLFDPQRLKAPRGPKGPAAWGDLEGALAARRTVWDQTGGAGLRLLTGRVTSPTLLAQIEALRQRWPGLRHVRYEPVHDDAARAGSRLAFGRVLQMLPRWDQVDVAVCLDADPLGPGPEQVAIARAWASRRGDRGAPPARLLVAEPALTVTGVKADRRVTVSPGEAAGLLIEIARSLGAALPAPSLGAEAAAFVRAAIRSMADGRGLVAPGLALSAECHALAAWVNQRLNAPIDWIAPVDPVNQDHGAALADLAGQLHAGAVSDLIVLGANPLYDAPDALAFEQAMARAPFTLAASSLPSETVERAQWVAPLSHELETWSDARAADGTPSIIQPLIRPLYATRSAHGVLDLITGARIEDLARVRNHWSALDDAAWREALAFGVLPGAPTPLRPPQARLVTPADSGARGLSLRLAPSPVVWDGSRAANAWLQETPHPLTKAVWGAALGIAATEAERRGLKAGDTVRLTHAGRALEATVQPREHQAPDVLTLELGGGRTHGGPVAEGLGPRAATLRPADLGWTVTDVNLTRTGHARAPLSPRGLFDLDGDLSALFPVVAPDEAMPRPAPKPSLLPEPETRSPAWAMVIDTDVCIGCNACVVACQAENTTPVIGPEEIATGRDMHWLRIDRYERDIDGQTAGGFQPVPCMHCETAPCEPVCPVEASVHDHQGLNVQVYNRCIGTRFCQANCPYKVRRFNFRDYREPPVYEDLDLGSLSAQRNPEVTVRDRGIMEKCTYCVQRITTARIDADREGRPLRDGEVRTACQSACPTNAIVFGDQTDRVSEVARRQADPRRYALLEELNTRPRTTYLAAVRNRGEDA